MRSIGMMLRSPVQTKAPAVPAAAGKGLLKLCLASLALGQPDPVYVGENPGWRGVGVRTYQSRMSALRQDRVQIDWVGDQISIFSSTKTAGYVIQSECCWMLPSGSAIAGASTKCSKPAHLLP